MGFINIEIKARTTRAAEIRKYLQENGAAFIGTDHQADTYFNVTNGRLKLREGKIENNLIFYSRAETGGTKQSNVEMMQVADPPVLRNILAKAMGVLAVVNKRREIYYIDNVKFHLDTLEGLGEFVEIEACDRFEHIPVERLKEQCEEYMKLFGVKEEDLVKKSYSDMVMEL
ncbi:MAG TPA: class IV adenylate cyclase [Chitinophagaceae bacterium]